MRLDKYVSFLLMLMLPFVAAGQVPRAADFDVLIQNGMVYDGTGRAPRRVDIAIKGDRIVAIGNLARARARNVVDANGLAVAPGFINMLSWSTESLIADGRSHAPTNITHARFLADFGELSVAIVAIQIALRLAFRLHEIDCQ